MTPDETFMRQAIKLARKGLGKTRPNPAVGCVIVKGGKILGRGWHRRAGLPHAEVEALRSLENPADARGATAYVTLEPCSTAGRTPPCTQALATAGIRRVVIGTIDPNPLHRGKGLAILRRAAIDVTDGVLASECAALNPEFNHRMATGLPWVIAKCGMSLDGRLTRPPGEGQWITSASARADAMKLRARVDAILVGAGTIRADNPSLTLRGTRSAVQPQRIIWAPETALHGEFHVFTDKWAHRTSVRTGRTLKALLRTLAQEGIHSVLVEGGGHTLGRLFDEGLANEVVFYIAPMLAGGRVPAVGGKGFAPHSKAPKLTRATCCAIDGCLRISGHIPLQKG